MFTIMTWNIENFFQPHPADRADFDAKLDALTHVIMAAEPDLLAVQEVGDEVAFAALRDELGAGWSGGLSTYFELADRRRRGPRRPRRAVSRAAGGRRRGQPAARRGS